MLAHCLGLREEGAQCALVHRFPVTGVGAEPPLLVTRDRLEDQPTELITVNEIILGTRDGVNRLWQSAPNPP